MALHSRRHTLYYRKLYILKKVCLRFRRKPVFTLSAPISCYPARETTDVRGYPLDIRSSSVMDTGYSFDIRGYIRDGCACTNFIMISQRYPCCGCLRYGTHAEYFLTSIPESSAEISFTDIQNISLPGPLRGSIRDVYANYNPVRNPPR